MDIVESLRKYQCPENKGCNPVVEYCQCALMDNSADEIERLRDSLERSKMNCAGWIASSALKEKE